MVEVDEHETVIRIRQAAETAFADLGFGGTSIRDISTRAGVNLAAINYHFGDKQSLYCSVIAHRLRAINRTRLEQLHSATALAGSDPIPLEMIVEIFARPLYALSAEATTGGDRGVRLLGRCLVEPLPFVDEMLATELHPVTLRFSQAIRRHLPKLAPQEFLWRLNFMVGAMHHSLATLHRIAALTGGLCQNDDPTRALKHFCQFSVAALTFAPPSTPTNPPDHAKSKPEG